MSYHTAHPEYNAFERLVYSPRIITLVSCSKSLVFAAWLGLTPRSDLVALPVVVNLTMTLPLIMWIFVSATIGILLATALILDIHNMLRIMLVACGMLWAAIAWSLFGKRGMAYLTGDGIIIFMGCIVRYWQLGRHSQAPYANK